MRLETQTYFHAITDKLAIYSSDPEDNNKEHPDYHQASAHSEL